MAERFTAVDQEACPPEAYALALEESTRHVTDCDRYRALNVFCDLIEMGQKRDDLKPTAKIFLEKAPELLEWVLGIENMAEAVWSATSRLIEVIQDVPCEAELVAVAQHALDVDLRRERNEHSLAHHLSYIHGEAPTVLQALLEEPFIRAVEKALEKETRWRVPELVTVYGNTQQAQTRQQSRALLFRFLPRLMEEDVGYASEVAKLLFEDTGSDNSQRKEALKWGVQAQMIGSSWEIEERDWPMRVIANHSDYVPAFVEGAQQGFESLAKRANGTEDKQAILHRVTRLYEEVGEEVPEVRPLCLEWLTKVSVEDERWSGQLVGQAFNWFGVQTKKHARTKRLLTSLTGAFNQLVSRVGAVPLVGICCTTETTNPLFHTLKDEMAKRLTGAPDTPRQKMVIAILESGDPNLIHQVFGEGAETQRKRAEEIFHKPARALTL